MAFGRQGTQPDKIYPQDWQQFYECLSLPDDLEDYYFTKARQLWRKLHNGFINKKFFLTVKQCESLKETFTNSQLEISDEDIDSMVLVLNKAVAEAVQESEQVIKEFLDDKMYEKTKSYDHDGIYQRIKSYDDKALIGKFACLRLEQFKELTDHFPEVEKALKEKIGLLNNIGKCEEAISHATDRSIKLANIQKIASHLKLIREEEAAKKTKAQEPQKKEAANKADVNVIKEIADQAMNSLKSFLTPLGQSPESYHLAAVMKALNLPNLTAADLKARKSDLIKTAVSQALIAQPPTPHDLTPKPPSANSSLQASPPAPNLTGLSRQGQTKGFTPIESKPSPRPR